MKDSLDRTVSVPPIAAVLCLLLAAPSCSLMGIGDLEPMRCASDLDCDAHNDALGEEACDRFVCDRASGLCTAVPLDEDGDGASPERCGGADCDDSSAELGPHVEEICGNDTDEDCDGFANDLDCDGVDAEARGGADCDDDNASIGPHVAEVCNGVDDDCNGSLDAADEDDDADGHADSCAGAASRDCDDEDPLTFFDAEEICDGLDNDCEIDGLRRLSGGPAPEPGEDVDGDGHVSAATPCVVEDIFGASHFPKDDCDDTSAAVYPGAAERCDGLDNDCDGILDNALGSTDAGSACAPVLAAPGFDHTCVLRADDVVVCWGDNGHGQLGADSADPFDAVAVDGVEGVLDLASGDGFSCAVVEEGASTAVYCWGRDQLVRGGTSTAAAFGRIPGVEGATALTAGEDHACVVVSGEVYCWGLAERYQLDGELLGGEAVGYGPRRVEGLADVAQIEAGSSVSCAMAATEGEVRCWGQNDFGQLGSEAAPGNGVAVVDGIADADAVACADAFCCALRRAGGGTVWCWGHNASGGLGCGGTASCPIASATPLQVPGLTDVVAIGAGGEQWTHTCWFCDCGSSGYACAELASGELRCWGGLGAARTTRPEDLEVCSCAPGMMPLEWPCATAPVDAGSVAPDGLLSFGRHHGCEIAGGLLDCWGSNSSFELGLGRASEREPPGEPASVIAAAVQVEGACVLLPTMEVRCAGSAGFDRPAELEHADVVDLGVGPHHWCAVRQSGEVQCSGDGSSGQLGAPRAGEPVAGLTDAVDVASGEAHSCALRRNGHVVCWGSNDSGQLGVPAASDPACGGHCSAAPLMVLGIGGSGQVAQIAVGRRHSCALTTDGEIYCWGENGEGQAGSPSRRDVLEPLRLEGLPEDEPPGTIAASAWGDSTCAVLRDGRALCWGGALSLAQPGGADPWTLAGMELVEEIALAGEAACGRLSSGAVRCVGFGVYDVTHIVDAAHLGCGATHCCLTRTSGQTLCFGDIPAGMVASEPVLSPRPLPLIGLVAGEG